MSVVELRARDPHAAAVDAGLHAFLNCYLRETDGWTIDDDVLRVPLPAHGPGAAIVVGVEYESPTRRHRFRFPARWHVGDASDPAADRGELSATTTIALLVDELGTGSGAALLARVLDSMAAVGDALERRDGELDRLWGAAPLRFEQSEQALLIGHMVHPTPKSRADMTASERVAFSPETAGRFPLHWLAIVPAAVHHDSATGRTAIEMARDILRDDPAVDDDALEARLAPLGERVLVPAHPWEAHHLATDPATADLFADGTVVDLGPLGSDVIPTTSVRTVIGPPDTLGRRPWQLKFSLHVRVTNSMRVTLPKELGRAVESARLAQTEVGAASRDAAPGIVLVQDPAFLTVRRPDGTVESGFSVLFREHSETADGDDITALTTLCQDDPYTSRSNRLGAIVRAIAERESLPVDEVGREWFARFCDVVVRGLVRLYGDVGLCFEAHQQNTLVELDGGWPVRGLYRDSQGYFHRELAHDDMVAVIPGLGEVTESIFPEALADERLVYYLFVNMTLGVVNALGVAGVADETVLLDDLRVVLEGERSRGGRYPLTLVDRMLDDERWPCKGNLRTRFHDMDELVGDIATQSVYVTIPNPLRAAADVRSAAS